MFLVATVRQHLSRYVSDKASVWLIAAFTAVCAIGLTLVIASAAQTVFERQLQQRFDWAANAHATLLQVQIDERSKDIDGVRRFFSLSDVVTRTEFSAYAKPLLQDAGSALDRPNHLDPSALATPSLAISCAAREALHQADVVETMLRGVITVIKTNDLQLAQDLRKLDDTVDGLYSAIKYYLTKISRQQLNEKESRRWTDIISFTINMEQIGDTVERVLLDIEDKKIRKGRDFSEAGMAEITELHARLIDNLRLGMSVFLNGSVRDAQKLLEEKARFRDLERAYATTHLSRLMDRTMPSMETSSLHIDLISDLKRINSHICSIAYPILDSAGALAPSRLREQVKGQ